MAASCLDLDQSADTTARRRGAAAVGAARGLIGARPNDGLVTVSPASPRPPSGNGAQEAPAIETEVPHGGVRRGSTGSPVFLGVDTHSGAHVGVALDGAGRRLGELTIPNSEAGYSTLLRWALGFGALVAAGVEGTGSYGGAGLSRFLRARRILAWWK